MFGLLYKRRHISCRRWTCRLAWFVQATFFISVVDLIGMLVSWSLSMHLDPFNCSLLAGCFLGQCFLLESCLSVSSAAATVIIIWVIINLWIHWCRCVCNFFGTLGTSDPVKSSPSSCSLISLLVCSWYFWEITSRTAWCHHKVAILLKLEARMRCYSLLTSLCLQLLSSIYLTPTEQRHTFFALARSWSIFLSTSWMTTFSYHNWLGHSRVWRAVWIFASFFGSAVQLGLSPRRLPLNRLSSRRCRSFWRRHLGSILVDRCWAFLNFYKLLETESTLTWYILRISWTMSFLVCQCKWWVWPDRTLLFVIRKNFVNYALLCRRIFSIELFKGILNCSSLRFSRSNVHKKAFIDSCFCARV